MTKSVMLHPDELPIADWLNTRANQPPPGAYWASGGTRLVSSQEFSFDDGFEGVLLELLEIYLVTSEEDPDLNPEAVNPALRLREKIVEAAR